MSIMTAYSDYFAAECLVSISSGPVLHRPTPVTTAVLGPPLGRPSGDPGGSSEDMEVRDMLKEGTNIMTVAGILTDLHGKFRPMTGYSESSNSSIGDVDSFSHGGKRLHHAIRLNKPDPLFHTDARTAQSPETIPGRRATSVANEATLLYFRRL
ncbi:hypothetical protein SKAU_G00050400 [Synaphobranchus kaupii]|uniref:Uncharacterized protein n=1 Tax=Synaphobranchus kaupii TaxID=118154 RepID=A0A9Q1J9Q0_SYNKA|nr:hypothetical protein SKAU_G00050400 [Synaphobranchus kaupii]